MNAKNIMVCIHIVISLQYAPDCNNGTKDPEESANIQQTTMITTEASATSTTTALTQPSSQRQDMYKKEQFLKTTGEVQKS